MEDLLYKDLSYKINGLLFKVHNELGRYKNEKQYGDKFELLLNENNIKYKREFILPPSFSGENKNRNKVDFFIEDEIIIDFKAKTIITKEDYFQMQRYLDASSKKLGIIVNFRFKYLKPKRIINSKIKLA
jgi:GxxExxY protein